jgi:lupus La protein
MTDTKHSAEKDSPAEKTENEKRARDEDDGADEKPAKRVDSQPDESPTVKIKESPATNGKKRVREEDEPVEPSAKKVDTKSEVAIEA